MPESKVGSHLPSTYHSLVTFSLWFNLCFLRNREAVQPFFPSVCVFDFWGIWKSLL